MAIKRGITPIIAIILVLMITVSAAGVMFYWLSRIQHQQQGTIESSQKQLFETLSSCVSIPTFRYNTIDNQTDVVFQNCGNVLHRIGDTDLIEDRVIVSSGSACSFLLNSSNCIGCPFTLEPGAVQDVILNFTAVGACNANIKGNIRSEISFFIDRKTSVSRTFVPEDEVICDIRTANLTAKKITGAATETNYTFNFTINNNGNALDTFTYTTLHSSPSCTTPAWLFENVSIPTVSLSYLNASQVSPGNNATLVVVVRASTLGFTSCSTEIRIRSNNCNSISKAINTTAVSA